MMLTMYDPFSGNMYGFDTSVITSLIAIDCYTKSEIDSKLSAVLKLCGQKETASQLPKSGNEVGDVWIIEDEGAEYAWVKALKWERLGPTLSTDAYATTDYVNGLVGSLPSGYQNVVAYIQSVANSTVATSTYNAFLSTNTAAIADAKKAGTDAKSALDTYKSSNDQAVATAKKSGDDAQTDINTFKQAQLVFESTVENITQLLNPTDKAVTTDPTFGRHKTYYKLVSEEYVALVRGTDYEATESISDFGETVYEDKSVRMSDVVSKINQLVAAGNTLISAHKQAVQEVVE